MEETGVSIKLREQVSGNHVRHHTRPCTKCVVFEASIKKGTPKPKREIVEIAWVKPDKAPKKLPRLPPQGDSPVAGQGGMTWRLVFSTGDANVLVPRVTDR